ncbi:hypothetical protein [Paenibacillus typhae]|uniref:Uncharacterized protein n=1 Tax=Paenibacillus typhae TaxID=1174501 RepID=A0A1G8KNJ6_9BACL|nr:hypothetical protein [Paenibacillus typhae]SDI44973.1 hypothetical protein SAMN05216192_105211 [Paenibacillus typhae]
MGQLKKRPGAVIVLYVLQAFLGIGAIGGGLMLLVDPSGEMMGMPVSVLERSPFDSFMIPGLLLLIIFGILPLAVLYGLVKKPDWRRYAGLGPFKVLHPAWTFSLYIGFGQIIWIMVQTYMMNAVSVVHVFYTCVGLLILAVTMLPPVQKYFMLDGSAERS